MFPPQADLQRQQGLGERTLREGNQWQEQPNWKGTNYVIKSKKLFLLLEGTPHPHPENLQARNRNVVKTRQNFYEVKTITLGETRIIHFP